MGQWGGRWTENVKEIGPGMVNFGPWFVPECQVVA
jgi:hypothetical protein